MREAALVTRLASRVPDFVMVLNVHAVLVRLHKLVQRTCSVFLVFRRVLADGQRKRGSVQHEAHLGTIETTWRERRHGGSKRDLHTISCT